jgi:oligopeptidase B
MGRPPARHQDRQQSLLLKTNMGAGHGGKSGRWDSLRETAEDHAFVLTQLGVRQ